MIDKVGNKLTYVSSGCIKTSGDQLPQRLKIILDSLKMIICEHEPDQVGDRACFR